MKNAYALIMAGGAGTRLWPLSRQQRPKPVLNLVENDRSMFQIAVERLDPLFTPDRVFVIANPDLTELLKVQCPEIPDENFILEPEGRDTAAAVGLGAIHIQHRDPEAVMVVLTADHYISDLVLFRKVLDTACIVAEDDNCIVTLGIAPTYPATGFGYIERGAHKTTVNRVNVYELVRFVEKPAELLAREYVAREQYSWNSGMFIWKVSRLMSELADNTPNLYKHLTDIAGSIGRDDYNKVLSEIWQGVDRISIDKALMEKLRDDVCVIPVEMGWQDIGNFRTLYDILDVRNEETDNVAIGAEPLSFESHNTLVLSEKLVALVGVSDLVVVETDDILLVCRLDKAQEVKKVVEELKKTGRSNYL